MFVSFQYLKLHYKESLCTTEFIDYIRVTMKFIQKRRNKRGNMGNIHSVHMTKYDMQLDSIRFKLQWCFINIEVHYGKSGPRNSFLIMKKKEKDIWATRYET